MRGHYSSNRLGPEIGKSGQTLSVWRRKGIGPKWKKIGGIYYYAINDVNEWLATECPGTAPLKISQVTR